MMTAHDIRHRLTKINRRILRMRELCTQVSVLNEITFLINDVCNLGDDLEKGDTNELDPK